jgi:putative flippase GtrA
MKTFLKEAQRYGAASLCALGVDMGILWILVHFFSWRYVTAATASFLAGAAVAYQLSVRLAFKQHRLRDRRAEFVSFVAIGTAGLAINAGVISVAVRYFGLHYIIAKCVAAAFSFTCNFLARRQLLFVRRSEVRESSHAVQ